MNIDIDKFKYFKCSNCKKVIVFPYVDTTIIYDTCKLLNKIETCCDKPSYLWGNITRGLELHNISESDLPEALKESIIIEYNEDCGFPLLKIKKGNKLCSISIKNRKIIINRDGYEMYIEDIFL